jgi:POT family proton-dependent oligopeptide transporter
LSGPNGEVYPTAEETETLRHVHGKVNWLIYTIGIVEMAERFAYYGTTAVCRSCLSIPLKAPVTSVPPS